MRIRRTSCAAALAVIMSGIFMGGLVSTTASAKQGRSAQTGPTTSTPGGSSGTPNTTTDLLKGVPTTAAVTTTTRPKTSATTRVADDNRRVWLVVAGLLVVAVLLALLTIWYWARTRPSRVVDALGPPTPGGGRVGPGAPRPSSGSEGDEPLTRTSAGPFPSEPSDESTSGLDHDWSDDDWAPRGRRRSERVDPPGPLRPARPQPTQREAALRRAEDSVERLRQ